MSPRLLYTALVVACCVLLALSLSIGPIGMGVSDVVHALIPGGNSTSDIIISSIRLPRAFAAMIVGAALGASGAALQGLMRNPLAEPGVLGVSASAAFGATMALYFGFASISPLVVPLSAVTSALIATGFMSIAAMRARGISSLILVGVGISSVAGALMSLLLNFAPNPFSLADMVRWLLGSVANRSFNELLYSAPFILVGLCLLLTIQRSLSTLSLGEEAAQGLGVNLKRTRLVTILGAGIASGASVALAGAIGFVGIAAPHIVRPLVGYDPGRTIIPSALAGAALVLAADLIVRTLPTPVELQLGVIIAILGAPLFIWIALREGNIRNG